MNYFLLYNLVTLFGIFFIPAFMPSFNYKDFFAIRVLVIFLFYLIYVIGMSRSGGIDMDNYIYAYVYDPEFIPDYGFQIIVKLFNFFDMPFLAFMLTIALINIFAIIRLGSHYKVSTGLLIIFWLLHIVIVRDFSQLRISFAISIAIIGLTSRSVTYKFLFYIASLSVHLTTVAFILAYECCKIISLIKSTRWQFILMIVVFILVVISGMVVQSLGFIDERIDTYIKWTVDGYGNEVNTYGTLILHVLIIASILFFYRDGIDDHRFRTLFFMELLGIVAFFALSDVSIFAFRLSNLIFSLYPVLLLLLCNGIYSKRKRYSKFLPLILLWFFSFVLFFRPGNEDILNKIYF